MKIRVCKICNQEFLPSHSSQTICNKEHYTNCTICNKPILLKKYMISKFLKGYQFTCCKECAIKKMKKTNLTKYGNTCSAQNKDIRAQINKNNLTKYGSISPFGNEKIKQKCLEKRINKSKEEKKLIVYKTKQTKLKRYGDANYNNPTKFKKTMQSTYGVNYTNESPLLKAKQQKTMLERYGSKSSFSNKILHAKMMEKSYQTNLDRYGVPYTCQLGNYINAGSKTKSITNQKFASELAKRNIKYREEFPLYKHRYIYDFKIMNILIEIDPTYTHNSSTDLIYNNCTCKPKDKNYHLNKTNLALENNYRCIHIFDWDDKNKIINFLCDKTNIYARNCDIKEVSKIDCDNFLDKYHLQNTCKGQTIRLGLYYENNLIEIMTFGKPRYNKKYEWELIRMCTKAEYKIIGGTKKLFNYFIKTYNPKSIISYCDKAKFTGDIYYRLGMRLQKITLPSCNWSKYNLHITDNLLRQRGYDQLFKTNYGKGISNEELMLENGWKAVYDCGQYVFEWKEC